MGQIQHAYSQTVPDGTATSVVRPSDWNSVHAYTLQDAVSLAGNTTGTLALISSGTLVLAGGSNITLSQNGQSVTLVGATVAGQPVNFSAGTTSGNLGSVVFSNSNGVSFGLSGSTVTATVATNYQSQGPYLTTAMQSNAATISNINVSGGTTSSNVSAVTFSNANGVTFGYDGTNVSASVATNYQSTGAYLTTAALSQDSSKYAGTNGAITGGSLTVNTSGVSINLPAYLTTAMQSNAATISNVNVSAGSTSTNASAFTFSNSGGVTFGLGTGANAGVVTATVATNYQSQGAYLTTAAQSQNTSNYAGINSAITGGSLTVNTSGISINISQTVQTQNCVDVTIAGNSTSAGAGYILISSGTLVLAGGNNVTLSQNGQSVTISGANAGGVQTGISGIVVSNTTYTSGTISFSNANGISFGSSAGQAITASYTVPATAGLISGLNVSGGAGNSQSNVSGITFSNSNGITFGVSTGANVATVTASYTVPTQTNQTLSLAATSNTAGNTSGMSVDARSVTFAGYGAASVGYSTSVGGSSIVVSVPAVVAQTNQAGNVYAASNTFGTSNGTYDARTLSIQGSGAVSVAASNSGWVISAPVQTAQTQSNIQAIYDGANSISTGTIRFTNANGVSFSVNGQTISASVAAQSNQTVGLYGLGNTTQNSSTTLDARSLSFNGIGGITVGYSNGSIQLSAATGGAGGNVTFSAGAASAGLGSVVFSNSNGVSFGLNGSTITATVAAQSNQTQGWYATSNTTGASSSSTFDARSITWNAYGAASVGFSGGSVQLSVPVTSSVSNTGYVQISTNGSTISIGATFTQNVYAVGNTSGTSSGTGQPASISVSGNNGVQVAASNGGWNVGMMPMSASEPFPIVTGTAFSSHAPASWWFNRVLVDAVLAVSNINVVKSLNAVVPTDTVLGSSGAVKHSYSHGITVFSRQNYGGQSSNFTTLTTASMGFTASLSYTDTAQSAAYSYVTDTTGGTTSFSTTSSDGGWSKYFTGPFQFQIPCVTTLQAGEYFFAHAHSSTSGTTGNSNFTLMSMSNLHIAPQVVGPLGVLQSSGPQSSVNPWGMGAGIASAVTTNATMPGSVVSGGTQNNWYMALSNA